MEDRYEEFTPEEKELLDHFVTNTESSIFALRNLPEVIKGALFSRYSRSTKGLRSLLLKEFICNQEEASFQSIVGSLGKDINVIEQLGAIKKAQAFYDRILDGYGDDSIGELGGAHLALENISMIAAKVIEDSRIGGSPLEKSTRYIYFDQKVQGKYLFYQEPILMTSAYRERYTSTCTMLFEAYRDLIPDLTNFIQHRFPKKEEISKSAYAASLRAKVLDCLRGILPAAALTNMGLYGNGRFFEYLIQKLHCNSLLELQQVGVRAYEELNKVIPSFVRRGEISHKHNNGYTVFKESMDADFQTIGAQHANHIAGYKKPGVRLISYDDKAVHKAAAALLYTHTDKGLGELLEYTEKLSEDELSRILDAGVSSRENRRHKSPRGIENIQFTFEILGDFGAYRDLQRHRILTQERQLLTCSYGFYLPEEIEESGMTGPYNRAMYQAKDLYDDIVKEFPNEAQYVVPMAYNIRWYFTLNLRALQWICELRSSAAGHPVYRKIAQQMFKEVVQVLPAFERFFKFVDTEGSDLGRLDQEERLARKRGE